MDFSSRLKQLRTERKITQQELAEAINKNRSTIAGYESENKQPDFDTLKKLADFFDVSIDYLVGKSDKRSSNSEQNKKPQTLEDYIQQAESLMLYGEVLDENDRQAILTAIKVAYETAIKKKKQKEKDNK